MTLRGSQTTRKTEMGAVTITLMMPAVEWKRGVSSESREGWE